MTANPLQAIQTFLLDMDGTVYLGPHAIPGAPEFVRFLRDKGLRYLFFTNNSSSDAARYARKLSSMNVPATPSDVLTSGEATIRFLLEETPHRRIYVVGTPSFEAEVDASELERTDGDPEALILAFDRTLTYAKLERACLLLREGIPYYATNPDKVCPTEYGYIPDCASMAALLYEATGRKPEYIGKPHPTMVRMALSKLGAQPATTAMVGDRVYTDMQMAWNAGITSILVLSGETTERDLASLERQPDYIFPSVRELHAALKDAPT
ncbi:MAG: haloacid dehalogenase [Candidatus Hydrogenedentota bacterium]